MYLLAIRTSRLKNQYQSIMADRIAISSQSSGVKSTPKGVSGNPGNPPKTAPD